MKIVVLDGYTLNPGDLSWDALNELGEVTVYDRTHPDLVFERSQDAGALLTNKTILDSETIRALPDLKYVGVLATGYNVLDLEAARECGVTVTNVPAYGTRSVAQMTFALLLEMAHHVGDHSRIVRNGQWSASEDFSFWNYPLVELDGLIMGIVGFGNIGKAVDDIARSFGMDVLVNTRHPDPSSFPDTRFVDLDALFTQSDVVSIHCPLTPETERFVNSSRLSLMKEKAYLINTSRGPVVDEAALAEALNEGRIAGAALDVLSTEPPGEDNPLLSAKNCVITPHIAWATRAARERLMETVVDNIKAFLVGSPKNVVGR
ncbi:D-2-hydroxyacid dehydrogenase [bacterium]|nr:MAG: D-2-hydroxyacid dehydrogenase [bacterium]